MYKMSSRERYSAGRYILTIEFCSEDHICEATISHYGEENCIKVEMAADAEAFLELVNKLKETEADKELPEELHHPWCPKGGQHGKEEE